MIVFQTIIVIVFMAIMSRAAETKQQPIGELHMKKEVRATGTIYYQ